VKLKQKILLLLLLLLLLPLDILQFTHRTG